MKVLYTILIGHSYKEREKADILLSHAKEHDVKVIIEEHERDVNTWELISKIKDLNNDEEIDGIYIIYPNNIEERIDIVALKNMIKENKDVGCLRADTLKRLFVSAPCYIPPKIYDDYDFFCRGTRKKDKILIESTTEEFGLPLCILMKKEGVVPSIIGSKVYGIEDIEKYFTWVLQEPSSITDELLAIIYNTERGMLND